MAVAHIDIKDLDILIYQTKLQLGMHSEQKLAELYWGYGYDLSFNSKFRDLYLYLETLQNYRNSLQAKVKPCLRECEAQELVGKVKDLTGATCHFIEPDDITVEDDDYDEWVAQNPGCVSREIWEECLYKVCGPITFDPVVVKEIIHSGITFTVKAAADLITRCQTSCCNFNYNVVVTENSCKMEYSILQNNPNCALNFSTYVQLRNCGLSYNLIKEAVDCNLNLNYNVANHCPTITTDINTYNLCNLHSGDPIDVNLEI